MANKTSFKDVCPKYIYSRPGGWEVRTENGNIPTYELSGRGIPKADKASVRNYLKGIKILFKRANEQRAFDDVMGRFKDIEEKYRAMLRSSGRKEIEAIGMGQTYELTSYIDGTFNVHIKKDQ